MSLLRSAHSGPGTDLGTAEDTGKQQPGTYPQGRVCLGRQRFYTRNSQRQEAGAQTVGTQESREEREMGSLFLERVKKSPCYILELCQVPVLFVQGLDKMPLWYHKGGERVAKGKSWRQKRTAHAPRAAGATRTGPVAPRLHPGSCSRLSHFS